MAKSGEENPGVQLLREASSVANANGLDVDYEENQPFVTESGFVLRTVRETDSGRRYTENGRHV